ncbi:ankyrin repeat-containing domain protein, partial [Staphylotrichum tortipilum]
DAIEILLERGANVNQVGGTHGCALIYAILKRKCNPDNNLVQRLLDAGADVNIQCGMYGCPVAESPRPNNLHLVEKLLYLGADVNAAAGTHGSPLILAVREGDIDVFRLLLARDANTNALYKSPLRSAIERPFRSALEVVAEISADTMFNELLENGADAAVNDSAAVVACARAGNTAGVIALLDRGANIHIQQGVPGKALHEAARECQLGTVKLLLERGVDVNSTGGKHGNALIAALSNPDHYGENLVASLLLDAGAGVNSPPSEKYTSPLHSAIYNQHFGVAQRLIDDGADVNAHDPRFGTALTAAYFHGMVDMMKRLVEMGAEPSLAGRKYGLVVGSSIAH